ncbi:Tripeptidyl-peptidase II [Bertholletia excelsa]
MATLDRLLLLLYLICALMISPIASNPTPQRYVVYMGSTSSNGDGGDATDAAHLELLSSVIPSEDHERLSLIYSYNHAFKGFSAMLTQKEASILSARDEVVSIFPDPLLQLHTTRSWDFLDSESGIESSSRIYQQLHVSSDIIIGMIDTGIWPESPSFKDDGIGEIPSRWKGVCMTGSDSGRFRCNRKLIGSRYYHLPDFESEPKSRQGKQGSGSPRDEVGHGTHTTSIATGVRVGNASYHGLATGTARGGSPSTRIAVYKACSLQGCSGSILMKAIDDAIKDGVDIISISVGMGLVFQPDLLHDPIAIGSFHAHQKGVLVVSSGGNDGPDRFTVVNSAPWIFTVTASTIDRGFQSDIILGNGQVFQGFGINFSNLTRLKTYPLASAEQVASDFSSRLEARNCYPGSLNSTKVAGKIIVCSDTDPTVAKRIKKLVVEDAKAKGLILISKAEKNIPFDSQNFPFSEVGHAMGSQILNYINSARNPTATILATVEVEGARPAPVVAYFSSRGPGLYTENILKPDVMAPGVAILAAMIPDAEESGFPSTTEKSEAIASSPSIFAMKSGTSMACPHVSGAAAFVKSVHPTWSSSALKSALMTTATSWNNIRRPLTNSSSKSATPHETGAGEINPLRALNPGLVFETTTNDYLNFFCHYGISEKKIRSISNYTNFSCPKHSNNEDLISNINYPSVSIGSLRGLEGVKFVQRTLTNLGSARASYVSSIDAPPGLLVNVSPRRIDFAKVLQRVSFRISFHANDASRGYNFGSITWADGVHQVRMPFAVNVE